MFQNLENERIMFVEVPKAPLATTSRCSQKADLCSQTLQKKPKHLSLKATKVAILALASFSFREIILISSIARWILSPLVMSLFHMSIYT